MQRYSYKALTDFNGDKAKLKCNKCDLVYTIKENGGKCPECQECGEAFIGGLDSQALSGQ